MAKEKAVKAEAVSVKATTKGMLKATTKQKGTIACVCNGCNGTLDVPVGRYFRKAVQPVAATPAAPALHDKEGNLLREAMPAIPGVIGRKLQHSDLAGSGCNGTLRTALNPQKKRAVKRK